MRLRFNNPRLTGPLLLWFLLLLHCFAVPAWSGDRQQLRNHVPKSVAGLKQNGRPDGAKNLTLAIGLPLRNQAELNNLLAEIYNPASPNFRRFISPAQFTERFGPTEQDYQAVIDYAKAKGLNVTGTHPNRVVLDVKGKIADVEKAFGVTLKTYKHPNEDRQFFAPDTEPSIDLAVAISNVSGLDDYSIPRPNLKRQPAAKSGSLVPFAGTAPGGGYAGNDFRAAYIPDVTLTGTGQSVALVQFDSYYPSDITAYRNQFGIPNIPLVNVPVNGGVSTPGGNNVEVCLDIEVAMAMAPGLENIYVYIAPNPSPWVTMLSKIANDNLSRQISCSWGGGTSDPAAEAIFLQMAAQGQSFFAASGDSDAFTGSIPFPDESPNITLVGGTTLTTSGAGGSYVSETVWNSGGGIGSSGGVSTTVNIPSWQTGINMTNNQGSTTKRNIPDVALTASNVYIRDNNGGSATVTGTSCAAPLWAAFTALVNQHAATSGRPPVGFINPTIYSIGSGSNYSACFYDTTTGNNKSTRSPTKYDAVAGYDLCTGWGSPRGTALIEALVGVPGPPAAPSLLTASPKAATILLTWADNSNNEDGFKIEQSTDGLNFTQIASVSTNVRTYTTGTVSPANVYYFRVRSFNTFNTLSHSGYSNITAAQLSEILIPWNATGWAYMCPMGGSTGVLPNRTNGTQDPNFNTTWHLPDVTFATQYDGPIFGATPKQTGTPGNSNTFDSGTGTAPFGFGAIDYLNSPSSEFKTLGTTITTPTSGQRYTAYFRKNFTVPAGGKLKPTIRYLMDDSGYIYLDGVLVATVNIPTSPTDPTKPVADTFNYTTSSNADNEATLQTIDLSQPVGSVSGTNARIWLSHASLTEGTHTIAVSVHQKSTTSPDLGLALELSVLPVPQISISATDPIAQESTSNTGTFTIARTGNTDFATSISFQTAAGAGQAALGTRYTLSATGGTITIPVGAISTNINVTPLHNTAVLGTQNITLSLSAGNNYNLGTPDSATVQLLDSPFNVWKIAGFGSLAAAQSPAAADSAIPAADNIPNLLKYALGLHPLTNYQPNTLSIPVVTLDETLGSRLTLTYTRPAPSPTDLNYFIESTNNVITGPWIPLTLENGYPLNNNNGTETLKASDTETNTTATQRFIRLRVERY